MRLDEKVAAGMMAAFEHQACVDLRWRIWPEVKIRYGRLIADRPRWWGDLSMAAALAVMLGWRPPNWQT